MVDIWDELAQHSEKGRAAYTYQQSFMYMDLTTDCKDAYRKIVAHEE